MNLRANFTKKSGSFTLKVNMDTGSNKLGFFGASGSGKSMTLKCIAGIETPDEGLISLGGRVLFDSANKINLKPQQRKIGYLFQSYALFPNMTVKENIIAGIRDKKTRYIIFEKSIESFALHGLEKKYPSQLSGGQQQRVALARVIASQPDLLLLDEPMSALDEELRMNTEKVIKKVMDESKGTIFVSHSRKEVFRLCDEIAFVKSGKIEGTQSIDDLAMNSLSAGNLSISYSTRGKMTIEIDPQDDISKAIRDIIKG